LLGFFHKIWGFSVLSGVFIENLGVFDSGQILEMHVVFSIQEYSSFTGVTCRLSQYPVELSRARLNQIV